MKKRQVVGVVTGTRMRSGATNLMRLYMVGDRHTKISLRFPWSVEQVENRFLTGLGAVDYCSSCFEGKRTSKRLLGIHKNHATVFGPANAGNCYPRNTATRSKGD